MRRGKLALVLGFSVLVGLAPDFAQGACGCSSMAVKNTGNTGWMCTDNELPDFVKEEGCKKVDTPKGCSTKYAYECPLGLNTETWGAAEPSQRTAFMPVATLSGKPGECHTGQVLQETIVGNGKVQKNPEIKPTSLKGVALLAGHKIDVDNSASSTFPQVGAKDKSNLPLFGGDNYDNPKAPHVLFNVTDKTVSWWDNTDQTKDNQAEAATWKYKFISFVLGSSATESSCACAFDIDVTWDSNTNPKKPNPVWTQDHSLSTNCK